jgi:hypothetical protein
VRPLRPGDAAVDGSSGRTREHVCPLEAGQGQQGSRGSRWDDRGALPACLREHWPRIKAELLAGRYAPRPVRLAETPMPGGGLRPLGIPTVLDRLIQQALHQVLQPLFDPDFSESGYGFRSGRSAWQPGSMWLGTGAGWWTWRNSSTGSTTTCSWLGWPVRSGINGCCASFAGFFPPGSWRRAWYRPASRGRRKAGRCRGYGAARCTTFAWPKCRGFSRRWTAGYGASCVASSGGTGNAPIPVPGT